MHLATKHNPNISTYYLEDGMSNGNVLNLNEKGFRMAVSVESFLGKKQKNDPKYVKYIFRLAGKKNGISYQKILPYHTCTDEDYDQFYPVQTTSKKLLGKLREDPDRGLMCIDWKSDDPELVGQFTDDDYTRLEVLLVPCNYLHIEGGYSGDSIHSECIGDLDKQIEYMGASNWIVYTN